MNIFDAGLNWLIKGHNSKITVDFQWRPTYSVDVTELARDRGKKSQVALQYQVYF